MTSPTSTPPIEPKLGPFAPPADHRFEPEFDVPAPRPFPGVFRSSRAAARRRRIMVGLSAVVVVGAIFLISRPNARLLDRSLRLLITAPVGIIVLLVIRMLHKDRVSLARYATHGVPTVARIRTLELVPGADGVTFLFRYRAKVEYVDPATGELAEFEDTSGMIPLGAVGRVRSSFRVGDYATAVSLPGDLAGTIRLLGFLDLHPMIGVVSADGGAGDPIESTLRWDYGILLPLRLAALVLVFAAFRIMFKFGPLRPLVWSLAAVVGAGAVGFGLVGFGVTLVLYVRSVRRANEGVDRAIARGDLAPSLVVPARIRPHYVVMYGFMSVIFSAFGTTAAAVTSNALLDASPAIPSPAVIDELEPPDTIGIFGAQVSGGLLGPPVERFGYFPSTPAEFEAIGLGKPAVALVRAGRFGWPWIDRIEPAP